MMIPYIASVIGWAALPISILRYQARTPAGILMMSALASFMFAAHYALIGAVAGAALTAAGGLTSLIQMVARQSLAMPSRLLIAAPSIALALYSSAVDPVGALAIVAFAASRLAETWSLEWRMRATMIAAAVMWSLYAAATGTLPVFIAEAVGLASSIFAFWRFSRSDFSKLRKTPLVVDAPQA
jgi:hypothetical protein